MFHSFCGVLFWVACGGFFFLHANKVEVISTRSGLQCLIFFVYPTDHRRDDSCFFFFLGRLGKFGICTHGEKGIWSRYLAYVRGNGNYLWRNIL